MRLSKAEKRRIEESTDNLLFRHVRGDTKSEALDSLKQVARVFAAKVKEEKRDIIRDFDKMAQD